MGILGAMATAISGLRVQSYALENISGNIANSQTTGFKRVDTAFVDLVPDLPKGQERSGSVGAFSRLTNTTPGDLQPTGIPTNMAISGEGYFIVADPTGGGDLFTRRGDFAPDKDGYLVNGAGYRLKGVSIDPVTGKASGTNEVLQLATKPIPANRTSAITYQANLPNKPLTEAAKAKGTSATTADRLLPAASTPTTTTPVVEDATFLDHSLEGGKVTVYDALGTPVTMELRWGKVEDVSTGSDRWALMYCTKTTAPKEWRLASDSIAFDASGQMTAATMSTLPITISNLTIDGTAIGNVDINFGNSALTQRYDESGLVTPDLVTQDGYSSGTLTAVSVDSDGTISGSYSNGRIVPIAKVPIAQFNADGALRRLDGGVYQQTLESGDPILSNEGATIVGGNVEGSNTDIADEFSKIIVTQQAYSANTRVVTTSQQMLADVLNMLR